MNSSDFTKHAQDSLASLPQSVKNDRIPPEERTLEALIHLNTAIYPHLKKDMNKLLEICRMTHGPDKLRAAMLWNIGVSQTSPDDLKAISQSP